MIIKKKHKEYNLNINNKCIHFSGLYQLVRYLIDNEIVNEIETNVDVNVDVCGECNSYIQDSENEGYCNEYSESVSYRSEACMLFKSLNKGFKK